MKEKTIDEIREYFRELVSGEKPNGKIQLARIWGTYQREVEKEEKREEVRNKLNLQHKNADIHIISDGMYIIRLNDNGDYSYAPYLGGGSLDEVYYTFDDALIALVAKKNNNIGAVPYICKMLDI